MLLLFATFWHIYHSHCVGSHATISRIASAHTTLSYCLHLIKCESLKMSRQKKKPRICCATQELHIDCRCKIINKWNEFVLRSIYLSIEVPIGRWRSFVTILRLSIADRWWTGLRFFRYNGKSTALQARRRWSIGICNENRHLNFWWPELMPYEIHLLCELIRNRPCVCSGGPGEFGGHTRNLPIRVAAWSVPLFSSIISVHGE